MINRLNYLHQLFIGSGGSGELNLQVGSCCCSSSFKLMRSDMELVLRKKLSRIKLLGDQLASLTKEVKNFIQQFFHLAHTFDSE